MAGTGDDEETITGQREAFGDGMLGRISNKPGALYTPRSPIDFILGHIYIDS